MSYPIQVWFDDQLQIEGIPERFLDGEITFSSGEGFRLYMTVLFGTMPDVPFAFTSGQVIVSFSRQRV